MANSTARTTTDQVEQANSTGLTPVVFIHGLWLLPSSWDRWAAVFEEAGYRALTPGWPDDPETVAEAKAHPGHLSNRFVGEDLGCLCVFTNGVEERLLRSREPWRRAIRS